MNARPVKLQMKFVVTQSEGLLDLNRFNSMERSQFKRPAG